MSNIARLQEAIEEKMEPIYMTTKEEIVEYYQDEYPGTGKNGWKQHIIHDLLPFTPRTGKDPAKNLSKRFDPQRLDNPEPRNKGQYEALGMTLPPKEMRPPSAFRVKVKGKMDPSPKRKGKGEQPRERDFEVDFSDIEAYDFAEDPSLEAFFEAYGIDGECADLLQDGAEIEVEAIY